MNKKIFFISIAFFTLACNFLFPQMSVTQTPLPTIVPATAIPNTPESEPTIILEASTAEILISYDDFMVVRLHPEDGDLQTLLSIEAQNATSLGLMPIVEFDATWCPPCQAIDKAIKEENELMLNAYRGTYIIKLDVDEWNWNDDGAIESFSFEFIPIYFKLDTNGEQTGEVIDGGAWNEDIPENIAPVMDDFFHN